MALTEAAPDQTIIDGEAPLFRPVRGIDSASYTTEKGEATFDEAQVTGRFVTDPDKLRFAGKVLADGVAVIVF